MVKSTVDVDALRPEFPPRFCPVDDFKRRLDALVPVKDRVFVASHDDVIIVSWEKQAPIDGQN